MENSSEKRSGMHWVEWLLFLQLVGILTYPIWGSILYLKFGLQMPGIADDWEQARKKQSSYFIIKSNDANITVLNDNNNSITFKANCDNGASIVTHTKRKFLINCEKNTSKENKK